MGLPHRLAQRLGTVRLEQDTLDHVTLFAAQRQILIVPELGIPCEVLAPNDHDFDVPQPLLFVQVPTSPSSTLADRPSHFVSDSLIVTKVAPAQ